MADRPRLTLPQQSYVFFLVILAVMVMLIWMVFKPFIIYMVTGLFVAVLALPIDRFWEKRLRNRMAAVMTMLTLFVMLALPVVGLGFALANDAQDLADAIQDGDLQVWAADGLNNSLVQRGLQYAYPDNTTDERNATVLEQVEALQGQMLDWLADFAKDVAAALPAFFVALTVILFVVYYVLTDGDLLVVWLKRVVPMPARHVQQLLDEANNGIRGVFVGQILTSLIQGALGGVGFFIVGLPGAVVWAALMAVLSLLPVVGAFLVWVPAAIFLFFQWSQGDIAIWRPIFLVIWGVVVVSQIDNFIRPKLIGNRARIHPIFVLIGVLGGVAAFGFIGLFLGPLVVGVTISILKVWETDYLHPMVGSEDPTVLPADASAQPPRNAGGLSAGATGAAGVVPQDPAGRPTAGESSEAADAEGRPTGGKAEAPGAADVEGRTADEASLHADAEGRRPADETSSGADGPAAGTGRSQGPRSRSDEESE